MKQIILNKSGKSKYGQMVALVDDDMYEELNQYKWSALKGGNNFYALRATHINGKNTKLYMHRQILGLTDVNIHTDHKDHNGLNNQKSNLRACTRSENMKNQRPTAGTSQYKGVCFSKIANKWMVEIMVDRKKIYLGLFINEIEAAHVYDAAAKLHHGEFANFNFK